MTCRFKRMKSTSMSLKLKMPKLKTTGRMTTQMMNSSVMRRLEISATLIEVSWTWGMSATEMESFCRNWISDPTGSFRLDLHLSTVIASINSHLKYGLKLSTVI